MIAAGGLQHVGDKLGGDGCATFVLLVLARVGEIRDDSGNAPGGSCSAGVNHDQKLHQAIIDVAWRSGLQDED